MQHVKVNLKINSFIKQDKYGHFAEQKGFLIFFSTGNLRFYLFQLETVTSKLMAPWS